ncbi:FAD-binding oxidoreductase [Glutamicibacter endophyticus]
MRAMASDSFVEFLETLRGALPANRIESSLQTLRENSRDLGQLIGEAIPPRAVLYPESVEEVQEIMRTATRYRVPIISRGAGSGVSGGVHVLGLAVVLNLSRMNRILDVSPENETATVEPGVINHDLNAAVEEFGLMYAPDPASYRISTIGGNIATNAGGLRCAKYGVTRESVLALDVVLSDGRLIHVGRQSFKGVAGYDLVGLFTGSEGTLGVVVGATVRLRYLPVQQRDLFCVFDSVESAVRGLQHIAQARVQPAILELVDEATMRVLDQFYGTSVSREGGALLLIRLDGYGADAEERAIRQVLGAVALRLSVAEDEFATTLIEMRRTSRGDTQDDAYRMGEDVAVPKGEMLRFVRQLNSIALRHEVNLRLIAHAGDGNFHPTFFVDPSTGQAGLSRLNAALEESVREALRLGGTITGEHGVGSVKLPWLEWEQEPDVISLQHALKEVLDPLGILNPGKAIPDLSAR